MKKFDYRSYRYNWFVLGLTLLYGLAFTLSGFIGMPFHSVKDFVLLGFQWGCVCMAVYGLLTLLSVNRWIFAFTFPIATVVCSIFAYFSYTIKVNVTPMLIDLVVSNISDYRTCATVVDLNLILVVLLSVAVSVALTVYRWRKIRVPNYAVNTIIGLVCVLTTNVWVYRLKNPVAERLPYSVYYSISRYCEERQIIAKDRSTFTVMPKSQEDTLTVVLVLGESLRADHMQMNGYERPTMPLMTREKNLVSYTDIYSQMTHTNASVPHIVTRADSAHTERAYTEESFITIFKQAGYHSVWLANQESTDSYVYFMNECDSLIYVNSGKSLYIIDKWMDQDIIPHYRNILGMRNDKQLIVVHSIGSHWYYNTHFDEDKAPFQPVSKSKIVASNTQEEMINSYDNTIVETDKVLAQMIGLLRDRNALLIFLSDHGESLGEDGVYLHATERPELHWPGCFVWYSDIYARKYPEKVEALQANRNSRYRTDFLFHSIIEGASIESVYTDKKLSIFNQKH